MNQAMAGRRPLNVLWLMSDQHSIRALGCYGSRIARTPRLDRLAAEGLTFERAYSAYPVCVPARFTMLTGRYPHHHGAIWNLTPLPLRERTVAHHFSYAGYATAFIGKMHAVDAQTHGFDYYVDMGHYYDYLGPRTEVFVRGMGAIDSGSGAPWLSVTPQRSEGGRRERNPWWREGDPYPHLTLEFPEVLPEEDHFDSFVARETIRFLQTYRDEPFFVVTSFLKPHNPFCAPAEYAARYRPEQMPVPEWTEEELASVPPPARRSCHPHAGMPEGQDWIRRFQAAYLGCVSHLDACIGRVLDALDDLGLAENTLVLYTTDHGEMLGEHGLWQKFNFFDPSANVPLLARLPGRVPAGARTRALVDQADFVPTLLELSGVDLAAGSRPLDGRSFARVLVEPAQPGKPFAFGEYALFTPAPFYMLREERWKYVWYTPHDVPAYAGPWEELYDPQADPGERRNLAADPGYAPVVAEQRARLMAFLQEQGIAR